MLVSGVEEDYYLRKRKGELVEDALKPAEELLEEAVKEVTKSPVVEMPTMRSVVPKLEQHLIMDFPSAIKEVSRGKKIHKFEWEDKGYYGVLAEGRLKLHKPDGLLYDWILSDGDLVGTDWIVLS